MENIYRQKERKKKRPYPPICIIGLFAVFAMSNMPACEAFFFFT